MSSVTDVKGLLQVTELQLFNSYGLDTKDIINVQALQESYPHLAVLDPVTYSYKDIEMILGQDVYHAIRTLEYFSAIEKRSPVAVSLPIGWVLSGPLTSSSCLTSTYFKVNIEHENELASQVKSWYDFESFGANKHVDSGSAADAGNHKILVSTTIHNCLTYDVGMLWAADNTNLPNNYFSSLVQLKSLEKRLAKDEDLREKYTSTIKEDLNKGYVIEVADAQRVESRSDKEWYLPHHPVLNPNKPVTCVGCSMELQNSMVPH